MVPTGRFAQFLAGILSCRVAERVLLVLVVLLCVGGNLPWHLDNYDQAKQAYVSYEIEHGGSWWYQHTPRGDTATKPPLAGWISLAFYQVSGSWDVAWRLPGLLCTLALLWLLLREGRRLLPEGGELLILCAFGLNLLTPRIATLVRTDMMLTLWITLCGWLIYDRIRRGEAWHGREQWLFFAAMLAAVFTKGPILYAFILPGMIAFLLLAPKGRRGLVWSGWWTWVLPLVIFVVWAVVAIKTNRDFYNDVVVKEFLSRFHEAGKSNEKQQAIWFYFPHLLQKFAPWSALLIALPLASGNVRRKLREPGTLWLVCWALGGLLCMTFIPSKRVDRIFPVVPPLCLLLVDLVAACRCGGKVRSWCGAAVIFSVAMIGGYFVTIVVVGYHDHEDRLVQFGQQVQNAARTAGITEIGVVKCQDEPMIIYSGGNRYLTPNTARQLWRDGKLNAVLIPERLMDQSGTFPSPALASGNISKQGEARYLLFLRPR